MTLSRTGVVGLVLAGALGLSACGSDNNSSSTPAAGGSSAATNCASGSITGAGSSAQANAMDEWVKQFQTACKDANVNYQSVGSGAGIQQFTAGTVDFAGSDSALKSTEMPAANARCKTGNAIDLPMVVGPIGVAFNVQGVSDLVLDASTVAKLFNGQIKTWNDPAIKALNPSATLPGTTVQAFHRSDSSGTTENFTKYLAGAAPSAWTDKPGKDWTAPGGQGAKGSEGVAGAVKSTDGAVGYVELSFVQNSALKAAKISTGAGDPVELTPENAGKAIEAAKITGTGNDLTLSIDYATKTAGVYPIVLVTYEIVCEKGLDPAKVAVVKSFLDYTASAAGQKAIAAIGYGALPTSFIDKVRTAVTAIG